MTDRAVWSRHPNFAGPASTLLAIHGQFRATAERIRLLLQPRGAAGPEIDLRWLGHLFTPLAQTLHHHHHAEEAMLFPLVLQRTGAAPEQLVQDHVVLNAAIDAAAESLRQGLSLNAAKVAFSRFEEVLLEHLAREEELVIPVLLELAPAEAWALIHGV